MKIKQVRLAQTIPGSSSNLLEADKYDLRFDGTKLHIKHKSSLKHDTFMVFPANIAYIEYVDESVKTTEPPTEGEQDAKKAPGRPKK